MEKKQRQPATTTWQPVQKWYDQLVGEEGHYYHQQIILSGVIKLLGLQEKQEGSFLDLACGQGVLARYIPERFSYAGVDISPSLIQAAKKYDRHPAHSYHVADVSKHLKLPAESFSHAAIILALQNIEKGADVLKNVALLLKPGGKCVVVLNHPCFRIPRQSSWQIDDKKKIQYRRMDCYLSNLRVPIQMHPQKGSKSPETWSFHHPISTYVQWGAESGLAVCGMEEWISDKTSTGKAAKMENKARNEFPLFLAILFEKK